MAIVDLSNPDKTNVEHITKKDSQAAQSISTNSITDHVLLSTQNIDEGYRLRFGRM